MDKLSNFLRLLVALFLFPTVGEGSAFPADKYDVDRAAPANARFVPIEPVMIQRPLRAGNAPKPATAQMSGAAQSLAVVLHPVQTNWITLQFFAVPVRTNGTMWVQSTSSLGKLPFTNVVGFAQNSAVITETFGCTAPGREFRLAFKP